jgi:hypothetical protein
MLEMFQKLFPDNMGMDLRKVGWEGVDWIHLAQDRDQWGVLVKQ